MRNLKVRLSEHLHPSSNSSLSIHLHENKHAPIFKDTAILATEGNTLKRKLIESICIDSKASKVCNTGFSLEIPPIWKIFDEHVKHQLAHSD